MRTPAGKECKYFYGNYFRGRNTEECRLLRESEQTWTSSLCATCPVPDVMRANACEFLRLRGGGEATPERRPAKAGADPGPLREVRA